MAKREEKFNKIVLECTVERDKFLLVVDALSILKVL